jgi:thioredoxin-related protein
MNKIIIINLLCVLGIFHSTAQRQDSTLFNLMPKIPITITDPSQRANYLAIHYWDNFNFLDSTKLKQNKLLERGFVDFIDLLSITSKDTVELAIRILMKKAEIDPDLIITFAILSEKYLYEPDSPLVDEEKFIFFIRYMIDSQKVAKENKIRPQFMLEYVLKNRIGKQANNFIYTLLNGDTASLHTLKANYTLLFFKNPTCEECNKMTRLLTTSPTINNLISQDNIKILTVYLLDDIEEWKSHAFSVPNSWIYARDTRQKIQTKGLYNIKRYPTIYLLDKNKKVLLKDTDFKQLENYLKNPEK